MTSDEERLITKRAARGDEGAFETIVREYEARVYSLSLKTLGNPEDAQDAAQETFIKVFTSLGDFKGKCRLAVWIFRICRNVCIDMLRKRRDDTDSLSVENAEGETVEMEIPDGGPSPEALAEQGETRDAIAAALKELPENYRRPLIMRDLWGLSYDEIAAETETELATVKTRIFRGRKRLAEILCRDGNFFAKGPSNKEEKGGEQV